MSSASSRQHTLDKEENTTVSSQTTHPISTLFMTDSVSHTKSLNEKNNDDDDDDIEWVDNITDYALHEYRNNYDDYTIEKEDIFYYVYGILNHRGYIEKFAHNLTRELPHIPMAPDFWVYSDGGRELSNLHLNYETCPRYKLKQLAHFGNLEKMGYHKYRDGDKEIADGSGGTKANLVVDKTKLKINGVLVFEDLPLITWRVNGRTPLEWVIDRYHKTVDKASGIVNDPTVGMTERRTVAMIERLTYVAVETDRIIKELSTYAFEPLKK